MSDPAVCSSFSMTALSGCDVAFTCMRQSGVFLTAPNAPEVTLALYISIMQRQWRGVITPGMILLSVNGKSDYPPRSGLGGREEGREGVREEGLRYQCAEPMAFPLSSWLASGQAAHSKDTWRTLVPAAACRTPRATSKRCSWDALSTQPALRLCLPTRPEARTDTTSSPTTATLMVTAVRG